MRPWSVLLMALLLACGDPTEPTIAGGRNLPENDAGRHDDDRDGGSSGSTDDDDDADQEPSDSQADCSDEARWIYLVDQNNAFLRFEPDTNKITKIGTLSCASDARPFSMAVSRDAVAYVLYSDGSLYQVSTDDASCKPTKFKTSDPDFEAFGMGFVSDSAGADQETLFIVSGSSSGDTAPLASLDTSTWAIKKHGTVTSGGELTGNGNGELWGFFPRNSPMMVRQANKSTGATLREFDVSSIDTDLIQVPTAWAFAFWGGRYYLFYQGSGLSKSPSTTIFRLTPETKKVETVKMNTGYTIVGAGVSTCAPVVLL